MRKKDFRFLSLYHLGVVLFLISQYHLHKGNLISSNDTFTLRNIYQYLLGGYFNINPQAQKANIWLSLQILADNKVQLLELSRELDFPVIKLESITSK